MERQFNACQTPRSMYLSIFNSFRVIRCLSQCISPKIAILPHFPWGRPWGNHAECCMKENAMLAACANLSITISEIIQRYICEKIVIFIIPPLHSTPQLGGFPSEYDYRHDGTPFGMEKLEWCRQSHIWLWVSLSDGEKISKISFFVLT